MKRFFLIVFIASFTVNGFSQPFFKDALKPNRDKLYRNLVNNTINKNLSVALTDSTEENWQDAFQAMELIHYSSPWIENRISIAAEQLGTRSASFQRSFLELIYTLYQDKFYDAAKFLLMQTKDPKIFAMCATYIIQSKHGLEDSDFLAIKTKQQLAQNPANPILEQLLYDVTHLTTEFTVPDVSPLLQKDYLPGKVLVISFQNKNRNFPGVAMVRDTNGNFIRSSDSSVVAITQLARSISNLPAYLTNGNTPEGLFRMDGFANSKSSFIGPTTNLQLTMPFEFKGGHFFADSTIADSAWDITNYKKLLPEALQNYYPAYQTFYAGKAGRTEIIAHGTTVNPAYYLNQPYYPISPTQGCLCTKEIWDENTGRLASSDQQKLADAVAKAGGAKGYLIVINITDEPHAISLDDILPYLKKAGQN